MSILNKERKSKMRFKQITRQVFTALLILCFGIGTMPVYALTDPDDRTILFQYSYENNLNSDDGMLSTAINSNFNTGWYNSEDETRFDINSALYGGVLKVGAADKDLATAATINMPKTFDEMPYVLSFDFMALQKNIKWYVQINNVENKAFSGFVVGNNGYCGFVKNGGWNPANPSSDSGAQYEVGKWATADIVIDPETSERKYYINGKFLGVGNAEGNVMVGSMHFLTGKDYIDGEFDAQNDGILIDNVRMNYVDEKSFYTRAKCAGRTITLSLSETPIQQLDNLDIYESESGNKISVASVKNYGKTIEVTASSELIDGKQYIVVYPDGFSSVSGNNISDRYVYFYSKKPQGAFVRAAYLTDYFGKVSGGYEKVSVTQDFVELKVENGVIDFNNLEGKITLKTKDGESAELLNPQLTSDGLKLNIKKFLNKDSEYILTAEGISSNGNVIPTYTTRFFTSNENIDGVFPIEFYDSYGDVLTAPKIGKIFASTKFINTSDADKKVMVALAAYKNNNDGLELRQVECCEINVPSGELTPVEKGENEVFLLINKNDIPDVIRGYIWNSGEMKAPLIDFSSIPKVKNISADAKIGVEQTGDKAVMAAAEFDESGKKISVYVSKANEQYSKDLIYVNQLVTADDKAVRLKFYMRDNDLSGDYRIDFSDGGTLKTYDFVYVNPTEFDTVKTLLDEATLESEGAVSELITQNYAKLGISTDLYNKTESKQIAKLMTEQIKNEKFAEKTWKQGRETAEKLFYIAAAAKGSIDNIFDYADKLQLEKQSDWEWYKKEFVNETVQKDITARLKQFYVSSDAFYDKVKECYVLAVVKNPDGEGNLRDVLKHFSDDIGISANGKDSTYRELIGDNYLSYAELKKAFNELEGKKQQSNTSGGNGGGRGNSGGFTGGDLNKQYESDNNADENTQTILKDIFDDIGEYEWAKQSIVYLAERGIVNGKEKTKFCPSDSVTREEFAAMLVRTFAKDAESEKLEFSDTEPTAWYNEDLGRAVKTGIVLGNEDGSFGIGQNITRQDMVVMLKRAADYAEITFEDSADNEIFSDDGEISDYAKNSVYLMKAAKVINGVTVDMFAPLQFANRAEAAKVIFGLLNI